MFFGLCLHSNRGGGSSHSTDGSLSPFPLPLNLPGQLQKKRCHQQAVDTPPLPDNHCTALSEMLPPPLCRPLVLALALPPAGNVNVQVSEVCDKLAGMQELRGGFNMVGFSQGGQFLRVSAAGGLLRFKAP